MNDFEEALKRAEQTSTSDRAKAVLRRKTVIAAVVSAVVLAIAGYTIFAFVSKTDFSKDVPMSESVSRWTPMKWDYPGLAEGAAPTAFGVEWKKADGYYEAASCTLRFVNLEGSFGESDATATDSYTSQFKEESTAWDGTSDVWVDVAGEKGRVQMVRADYTDGSATVVNYYRGTPANGILNLAALTCEDAADVERLAPKSGGAELGGVKLKPSLNPVAFNTGE